MRKHILIIGAGIHGVMAAVELARNGHDLTIIDGNKEMLLGSSFATHNRIHLGYHYPRSKETAEECRRGFDYFAKHLNHCLLFPDFYYAIEKNNSYVTAKKYKEAMGNLSLECVSNWPEECFLDRSNIEDCFKVNEACFDIWALRETYKKKFEDLGVKEIYSFEIDKVSVYQKNIIRLISSNHSELEMEIDLILNCTYTYSNNILKIFSIIEDLIPYKFEDTEIAVVESDKKLPALTIMDGPFITILPYAGKENNYLVYDKINSVINQNIGVEYESMKVPKTNWDKMKKHGLKYYPFFEDLSYKYSLYGKRPISLKTQTDSRTTKIVKHNYPIEFYSILEGKFVSAPLAAERINNLISREKNALIGYSGFIGSSIKGSFINDDLFNSKNIQYITEKDYSLVVSCANSSSRWKANIDPEHDYNNIKRFIDCIKTIKTDLFVLISTIDVYEKQYNVFEDSDKGNLDNNSYGKNRLFLENFVKNHFINYLIVRLPITYGFNFRKNVIYDILNNKDLDKINTEAIIQIYNVTNLMKDINIAVNNNLNIVNIATEPVSVKEILEKVFYLKLDNRPCPEFINDMKTHYAKIFGLGNSYAYNKRQILNELIEFKREYETKRI